MKAIAIDAGDSHATVAIVQDKRTLASREAAWFNAEFGIPFSLDNERMKMPSDAQP